MDTFSDGLRNGRPSTEDCITIKLPQLKQIGMLKRGCMSRRSIACYEGGRTYAGTLTVVSDIDCLEPRPCIVLTGVIRGRTMDHTIPLESHPMRFGGERWYARCPLTDKRCTTLVLPRGKREFASMAGWGVAYASQRLGPFRRMFYALDKAEERLEGLSKYTRKPTRRRHRQKVSSLIFALAAEVDDDVW